jgi:ABC-type cobalamin/Fe3+-siderophores transport system ATPase subunit
MSLLKDIAHSHDKAILLSSHDIELALHYADSLWVIDRDSHIYTATAPYTDRSRIIDDVFGAQSESVKDFLKL